MTYEEAEHRIIRVLPDDFLKNEENREALSLMGIALGKQIPKKPIKSEKFLKSKHTVKVAVCPNCNSSLGLCNYAKTTFKYCGDCGQALDWSDIE